MNRDISLSEIGIVCQEIIDLIFDKVWSKNDITLILKLVLYIVEGLEDWDT